MGHTVHATAPGRVNLIGEHTDYNGGFVLPTAIPQRTRVVLTRRDDREVGAHSANASPDATYALGGEQRLGTWADYVKGITWAVTQAGLELGGFDLDVQSD